MPSSGHKIRPWHLRDIPALAEMTLRRSAKDGVPSHFTDPRDQNNGLTFVAEDESGSIIASMTGRFTAEIMLTVDPSAAEQTRKTYATIVALWEQLGAVLFERGCMDVHAPVAPWLKRFAERMVVRYGFTRDPRHNLLFDLRKKYEQRTGTIATVAAAPNVV